MENHKLNKQKMKKESSFSLSRNEFLKVLGIGSAGLALSQMSCSPKNAKSEKEVIQGFDELSKDPNSYTEWVPISDRKVRVGLIGYGVCRFATQFGFQHHPNVEIVAVSDIIPERCAALAKEAKCEKTYPSLEELIKDDSIEAVFVATDAASHADHCIKALEHGKHVAVAVPAVFGSLEDADRLFETVKRTGLNYMMFETSYYRANNFAMRKIYNAGGFGNIIYTEGEYYHPAKLDANGRPIQLGSYKGWRNGMPPQWYPTHSDAYHIGVTNGSFLEVSCLGIPSKYWMYQSNQYNNPFGTEISLYRTSEGGMARMARSSDTQGHHAEDGRIRGERGTFYGKYEGLDIDSLPDLRRPGLPEGVPHGGHGGSHGNLMQEFIYSIIENRTPEIDIAKSLNMTVGGIVAHQSALKDGEWLKIPQYKMWT